MSTEEIARSFSLHAFAATYDSIAADATWTLPGAGVIEGRDAIMAACEHTLAELDGGETTWLRVVSTGDGDVVAVDAIGRYATASGVSTVSSCDIYEFAGAVLVAITSYAVELDDPD